MYITIVRGRRESFGATPELDHVCVRVLRQRWADDVRSCRWGSEGKGEVTLTE